MEFCKGAKLQRQSSTSFSHQQEAPDRVLTQGGPGSTVLFNLVMDTLIRIFEESLQVLQRNGGNDEGALLLSFAEDVVLQAESYIQASIAFRALDGWAKRVHMIFIQDEGKGGVLIATGRGMNGGGIPRGEGIVLESTEVDYLGFSTARDGTADSGLLRRMRGTQAALRFLNQAIVVVVRGMDARKAAQVRKTFLEARWSNGLCFAPLGAKVVEAIYGLDVAFISIMVCSVKPNQTHKLAKLWVLMNIHESRSARRFSGIHLRARTCVTAEGGTVSVVVRERAELILTDLAHVMSTERVIGEIME